MEKDIGAGLELAAAVDEKVARVEKVDIGRVVVQKGVLYGLEARALAGQEGYEMPAGVTVADLDADGVFWGTVQKHGEDIVDQDLLVPAGIDLKPGAYRWNASALRFDPLEKARQKITKQAPTMERALYEMVRASANPSRGAAEWADWYEKSLDAGIVLPR
jgi:hypothetical protein